MKIDIFQDLINFIETTTKDKIISSSPLGNIISILLNSKINFLRYEKFFRNQNYDLYLDKLGCSHLMFKIDFEYLTRLFLSTIKIKIVSRNQKYIFCEYILCPLQRRFFGKAYNSKTPIRSTQQSYIAHIMFRKNENDLILDKDDIQWLKMIDENNSHIFIKFDYFNFRYMDSDPRNEKSTTYPIFLVAGTITPKYLEGSLCKILYLDKESLLQSSRRHFAIRKLKKNDLFSTAIRKYKKWLWKPDGHFCRQTFESSSILK